MISNPEEVLNESTIPGMSTRMDAEVQKKIVVDALEDMKAVNIVTLDVTGLTDVMDYLVIASGTSSRHVKSLADNVCMQAKKRELGLPDELASCHTAVVGGYVVEGHVPAADIKKMLTEKPAIAGLAVPGMVTGSPGMEMGEQKDRYDVLLLAKDGTTTVFASHG